MRHAKFHIVRRRGRAGAGKKAFICFGDDHFSAGSKGGWSFLSDPRFPNFSANFLFYAVAEKFSVSLFRTT